jgi:hypothetical protein
LSDQQRSGSNQIRQSSALIGVENGVNLLQGLEDSVSQSDFTLDAKLASLAGFGSIKNIARESVREGRYRSPAIHFGLSALGLELIQDASEDGNLPFVQVELVCEEAQWSANAKASASTIASLETFLGAVPGRTR